MTVTVVTNPFELGRLHDRKRVVHEVVPSEYALRGLPWCVGSQGASQCQPCVGAWWVRLCGCKWQSLKGGEISIS